MKEIVSFNEAKKLMASYINILKSDELKHNVYRIEIKIYPIDEIAWIARQKFDVKIFGANQDNSACIAGVGEAISIRSNTKTNLKQIFSTLRKYLKKEYPYLQWYGGLAFDPSNMSNQWRDFGAYRFVIPRFEIASDASSMIFCCNLVGKISEAKKKEIIKQLDSLQDVDHQFHEKSLHAKERKDFPSKDKWENNIIKTLNEIKKRKFKKVVLARQTLLQFSSKIDPWDVLSRLFEVTPNSYHFCFEFNGTAFVGASPERLYRKYGRSIISEAIAGTSSRGKGISADYAFKEELLASHKNNREHAFVVDAIDEGFSKLCHDHDHNLNPSILTLGNGHHLMTGFQGRLKEGMEDEDIIETLHPTPAVGGVPTKQAKQLLAKLEGFGRGWYTGLIGYVGLDWSEFVVGIRSALIKDKQMCVYAGAGIVEGSEAKEEWQEIENKISNFIKLIQ